jgi:hypothetical protein
MLSVGGHLTNQERRNYRITLRCSVLQQFMLVLFQEMFNSSERYASRLDLLHTHELVHP